MKIALLLLFHPFLTVAYNIDWQSTEIYRPPLLKSHSYFGYSVLLASRRSSDSEPWIFVGAPKANYTIDANHRNNRIPIEPGITYRCAINNKKRNHLKTFDTCVPMNVTNPDDEIGFIEQVQGNILIEKGHGFMGAAMSLHEPTGSLTVCAPRTIVRIYNHSDYQATMQGVCYNGNLTSGNLYMDDKHFSTYNFSTEFWWNPVNGFAVHHPPPQATSDSVRPVIGSPKHDFYGSVRKMGQLKAVELPMGDYMSNFGYALTSGHYFRKEQLMVAAGAPGWHYVGQVAIMDPRTEPLSIIALINGEEVGEYFGASLATGDMNNDGLDDLIVGSPHWKNDNGRVQIFLGNKAGFYAANIVLEGGVDDALYGYAVTSGDLDGDGADDLIVGAPWEEGGVIYVYNGDTKLDASNLLAPSQRIPGRWISDSFRTFGFALSEPVDIDGDGFPDVAVGAYASEQAVILKTMRTRINKITLSATPKTLSRNSSSFLLEVCIEILLFPRDTGEYGGVTLKVEVDSDYQRVESDGLGPWYMNGNSQIFNAFRISSCSSRTFLLKKNNRNYVDAIGIVVEVLPKMPAYDLSSTHWKWTEYKMRNTTVQIMLPFDIGCGVDDICHAFIYAKVDFQGIRNSSWIIGSEDLRLVLQIGNRGEPAYSTTVTFEIPREINLRSILPSCLEEKDPDVLRVTCDVGNPLETTMSKLSLDLDMNGMRNGSADGTTLNFYVEVKTRSVNLGISKISIPLHLKANLSVALSGKAYDNHYYLKHDENNANLTFHHAYQIARSGATPISSVQLTIKIPYKLHESRFLSIAQKPQIFIVDRFYECSAIGIPVLPVAEKSPFKTKIENDLRLDAIASHSRSRRTASETRTDTVSSTEPTNFTQREFYTMSKSGNVDVTYLNCSTANVTCGQVVCNIILLKPSYELGKLHIQLVVNDTRLAGGPKEREQIVHITTEASVEVLEPKMQFIVAGTGIIVPVTTTLHRAPDVRSDVSISIWVILGSVLLGLLALCLIAVALWKIGFFRRYKKEELDSLKTREELTTRGDEQNDIWT